MYGNPCFFTIKTSYLRLFSALIVLIIWTILLRYEVCITFSQLNFYSQSVALGGFNLS